jgi:hypothetical protein
MIAARAERLSSKKTHIAILVDRPTGWAGPAYKEWPSYETWSFSKGADPSISYLQVRIEKADHHELDWNAATKEQIKNTFDDFVNPEIDLVATVAIDKTPVAVWGRPQC